MKSLTAILSVALTALLLSSCNDDNTLGASLVEDQVDVEIYHATAPTGRSVANPSIQSRSIVQLLGIIEAKGFGRLSSDIVTQFMPASVIDTREITPEKLDSVMLSLEMYSTDMTGDSLVPMGLKVHRLVRELPAPIYSDFDPAGYYDPAVYASAVYIPSALGLESDSALNAPVRAVNVKLPKEFGVELLEKYAADPQLFNNPTEFARWFPGFYIANSFGSGRVIRISRTSIKLYTGSKAHMLMAVTPEVVNNSDMSLTVSAELQAMAQAGKPLIVAPVGYDVELRLPTREIVSYFRSHTGRLAVVNALTMSIPATAISNGFDITPPAHLLLVRSAEKDEFFARNKIPDNVYSFYATYNSTTKSYDFTAMKAYLDAMLRETGLSDDDENFTLTPVNVTTEANTTTGATYITGVAPYVGEPKMVELDLEKAKITLTFSKQSLNN